MSGPDSLDRRFGRRLRVAVDRIPGGRGAACAASDALAPAFEALVVSLLMRPSGRRAGVEALASGFGAAAGALLLRDRIGRTRPGGRPDGAFPSRHAAAAVAIACAVGRRRPQLRPWLAAAAGAGLVGPVVDGQHDPADIAAGALLGWAVDAAVGRLLGDGR
jgi:membrane-associated phospholipid phosphatase